MRRLGLARNLLAENQPLTVIPLSCDFADQVQLSRHLKSAFGLSPAVARIIVERIAPVQTKAWSCAMARWVAIFEDNAEAEAGWVRKQHAADHFEYLKTNSDRIKLAGGLRPSPDQWWNGGLWVMEVETREEAERLCENDPYFKLGLRKSYRLQVWGKAPVYGDVVL